MDSIDRQAAMLRIAKVNPMRFKSIDDFHDACVDCLKELPSTQSEQQWIPCSERMPEPYVKVLVSDVDGDICFAWFEDHWGEWWSDRYGLIEVLAWMPLPKAYEENE